MEARFTLSVSRLHGLLHPCSQIPRPSYNRKTNVRRKRREYCSKNDCQRPSPASPNAHIFYAAAGGKLIRGCYHDPLVDTSQSDCFASRSRLLAVNQQERVSGTTGAAMFGLWARSKNALLVNSIQKGRGLSAVKELFSSRPCIPPHCRKKA